MVEKSGKWFFIKCQAINFHMFFTELNYLYYFLSNAVMKCYSRDGSYCNYKMFHGTIGCMPYRRACLINGCALAVLHCIFCRKLNSIFSAFLCMGHVKSKMIHFSKRLSQGKKLFFGCSFFLSFFSFFFANSIKDNWT